MSRFKLDKNEKNGGDYLGGSKGDEIHGENPPIWRAIDRATGGNGSSSSWGVEMNGDSLHRAAVAAENPKWHGALGRGAMLVRMAPSTGASWYLAGADVDGPWRL